MISKKISLFGLMIMLCWAFSIKAQEISYMTFNIRYDTEKDGQDQWTNRREDVAQLMDYYHPDVLGIQEGLHRQVEFLKSHLNDYKMIGVGRDDGDTKGEYSSIFYDTTKMAVLEEGTFWLSETPEKVSVGWDASMERICTYGLFRVIESGIKVFVFNAHFDHIGPKARLESARLVMEMVDEKNKGNFPVVFMGDFNSVPSAPPIMLLKNHFSDPAEQIEAYGPAGTSCGFTLNKPIEKRIDYIFSEGGDVLRYRHVDDRRPNGRMVSDHLPVLLTVAY